MTDERFDSIYDVFDGLAMDSQQQPLRDEIMSPKNEHDVDASRRFVNQQIDKGVVTAAQLARETGYKPSAISAFRNDKWKGSPGTLSTLAGDCYKVLNRLIRKRRAEESRLGGFVQTHVARQVMELVQYAVKRDAIAAFCLPAGAGKTMVLQAIHEETPGSILVTVTRSRSSVKSFLQAWARLLGEDDHGRAEDIQDRIVERLRGTSRLTLIDEAHKLSVPALDAVREIYDAVRVPIVLAGTPSFKSLLTSQRVGTVSRELLDQLYSRVGVFRDMSDLVAGGDRDPDVLVTIDDIHKLFARGRVWLSRDGADFLYRLANTPAAGGLRRCHALVQIVLDVYPSREVTVELLRQALATTIGTREAGFVANLAAAKPEPEPAAALAG